MRGKGGEQNNLTKSKQEDMVDKGLNRLWQWGTVCIFDAQITDLDRAKNRGSPPDKILEKNEK